MNVERLRLNARTRFREMASSGSKVHDISDITFAMHPSSLNATGGLRTRENAETSTSVEELWLTRLFKRSDMVTAFLFQLVRKLTGQTSHPPHKL